MPNAKKPRRPTLKRKNLILDQGKIDRARKILGAATETEAITRALDAVSDLAVFGEQVDRGLDRLVGKGGFTDQKRAPTIPSRDPGGPPAGRRRMIRG